MKERFQEEGNNLKAFIDKEDWSNAFKLFNRFFKNISYGMDKFLMKNKPIILIGVNFDSDERGISDWKVESL